MTCAFLGGSAGSWLGVRAYSAFGWNGVCGLVALLAGLALLRHVLRGRPVTPAEAPVAAPSGTDGVPAGRSRIIPCTGEGADGWQARGEAGGKRVSRGGELRRS
ncbi:hypothetical protein [Streptomyces sp. NPDC053069]|uniref:hypothetical protein n=1 Tax=Streptomyces sp. NPDC053069 TaxID=3365695 RepID=UPI0037CDE587